MFNSLKDFYSQDNIHRAVVIAPCVSLIALSSVGIYTAVHQPTETGRDVQYAAHANIGAQWPESTLAHTADPGLQQLAQYKELLGDQLPDKLMLFVGMPASVEEAPDAAKTMADTLTAYHSAGVEPLVIMEPTFSSQKFSLADIAEGRVDGALKTFYETLRQQGISEAMMGQWVLLPEANTPAWDTTDPVVVRNGIIRIAQAQKAVFPGSETSVMFDSQTYQTQDWGAGDYTSLAPYVQGIPKGLIDSVGLQGFPWVDSGASPSTLDVQSPHTYLSTQMVREAADSLGVHKIWFNTGTFASMHNNEPGAVHVSAEQRRQLFGAVSQEIIYAKTLGYDVTVNVFAKDKSHESEGTDWSYSQSVADKKVLAEFIEDQRKADVRIALFDDSRTD